VDLHTVERVHAARTRADLAVLTPDTAVLAGGTWLFSDPQTHLRGLLDVTAFGWPALVATAAGLEVAATCTIGELAAHPVPLFDRCAGALVGSFKIQNTATVGGNICLALPAGPMTSLCAALDGVARLWTADGERAVPVAELVTGDRGTLLRPGEVLRSVLLPAHALAARHAYRRASLSPEGRSGSLVIGRRDADGAVVLTVTAAVDHPHRFAWPGVPSAAEVDAAVAGVPRWFADPHGRPDWRRAVTRELAQEIREELA
jgi:CO/xanthine dehydrogenase FAD-binding subunit